MLCLKNGGYHYEHSNGLYFDIPSGNDFYVFVFFRTPASVCVNGAWQAAKGHCILYSPFSPQLYRSESKPYVNDWLHIEQSGNENFFNKIDMPLNKLLEVGRSDYISVGIKNLFNMGNIAPKWRRQIENNELENLFYRLVQAAGGQAARTYAGSHAQLLAALRARFYSNPQDNVKIAALAAESGLSPSHFQLLYKKTFGISIGEDIINSRVQRACFLLQNSSYAVGEIAFMSGYSCNEHFMRQFKKRTGKTPSQYRKNFHTPKTAHS